MTRPIATIVVCSVLSVVLSVALSLERRASAADTPKPNIIYIMDDELGYFEPAFMGGTTIVTPNLDRMAAEGIQFNNLFAGSAAHPAILEKLAALAEKSHEPAREGTFARTDRHERDRRAKFGKHDDTNPPKSKNGAPRKAKGK